MQWLIRRFEALDARLIALELATARGKRPPTRAADASESSPAAQRSRPGSRGRRTRRR